VLLPGAFLRTLREISAGLTLRFPLLQREAERSDRSCLGGDWRCAGADISFGCLYGKLGWFPAGMRVAGYILARILINQPAAVEPSLFPPGIVLKLSVDGFDDPLLRRRRMMLSRIGTMSFVASTTLNARPAAFARPKMPGNCCMYGPTFVEFAGLSGQRRTFHLGAGAPAVSVFFPLMSISQISRFSR
jgi:hypothetical protein